MIQCFLCTILAFYLTAVSCVCVCAAVLEGVVPAESTSAVLQAMDCHPTSEKTLTQGCLALGNIGRAGQAKFYVEWAKERWPNDTADLTIVR